MASSGKKLAAAAAFFTCGNFAQKGLLLASLPFYANILSVEDYGRWSLFLGLASICSIGFDLCWSRAIPRLYYEYWDNEPGARGYLFISFVQRLLLVALVAAIFLCIAPILMPLVSGRTLTYDSFGVPLAIAGAADASVLYVCAVCRARQNAPPFVALKLSQSLAQLSGSFLAFYAYDQSPAGAAIGFAVGSLAVAVGSSAMFLMWVSRNRRDPVPFAATLRKNAAFSFPLVFHEAASWLRNSADPFIIVHFLTLYAVSVYHVGYQFGLIVSLLLYSAELSLSPFFFELMKRDSGFKKKYVDMNHFVVGCTFVVVSIVSLFSREAIVLMFPGELREASRVAPVVVSAYFFHGLYAVYVRTFILHGKTVAVPLLTVGPTLAGIGATLMLTPVYGLMAPAYVTVASFVLLSVLVYRAAQRVDDMGHAGGVHAAVGGLVLAIGIGASFLWDISAFWAIPVKAVLLAVLLLFAYDVFFRGRGKQMRDMVAINAE